MLDNRYFYDAPNPPFTDSRDKVDYAARYGDFNYIDGVNEIINAIIFATPDQFDTLCKKYPNYKITDYGQGFCTALRAAAACGKTQLIDHIIEIGGKFLALDSSPLKYAVLYGQFFAVKKLIQLDAPINDVTSNGQTPLEIALHNGYTEIASMLLRLNAYSRIAGIRIGNLVSDTTLRTFEAAKQKMITESEKTFMMIAKPHLPYDVIKIIMSLSAKLI